MLSASSRTRRRRWRRRLVTVIFHYRWNVANACGKLTRWRDHSYSPEYRRYHTTAEHRFNLEPTKCSSFVWRHSLTWSALCLFIFFFFHRVFYRLRMPRSILLKDHKTCANDTRTPVDPLLCAIYRNRDRALAIRIAYCVPAHCA